MKAGYDCQPSDCSEPLREKLEALNGLRTGKAFVTQKMVRERGDPKRPLEEKKKICPVIESIYNQRGKISNILNQGCGK